MTNISGDGLKNHSSSSEKHSVIGAYNNQLYNYQPPSKHIKLVKKSNSHSDPASLVLLPCLQILKLFGTDNLTDAGFANLTELCGSNLKEIVILRTRVSKRALDLLRSRGINVL